MGVQPICIPAMEFLCRPCQQRRLLVYFGSRRGSERESPAGAWSISIHKRPPEHEPRKPGPGSRTRPSSLRNGGAGALPWQAGKRVVCPPGSSTRHSARPTEGTKCSLTIIRCQARILFGEMPGGGWERAPPPKFMSSQASGCDLFRSRVCETSLGKDLQRKPSWS